MPKFPPPPRSAPEQLGVLVVARVHQAPVGGDDVGGDEVVAGQPVLAHEPADAAAEREPGDPGRRDEPAGHGEPEGLRLVVEVAPRRAALGGGGAPLRVDAHGGHAGQVDDDAAVDGGEAGERVPAAAHGDEEVLAAGEVDRAQDVGDPGAADDERRAPVVGAVPDRSGFVVGVVLGPDELPSQALLELVERRVAEGVGGGRCWCHVVVLLSAPRVFRSRSTLPGRT